VAHIANSAARSVKAIWNADSIGIIRSPTRGLLSHDLP
jgi:hypothetical protein